MTGCLALKCWHPFTPDNLNGPYECSAPPMGFRPVRNYLTSFAASDHVPKGCLRQREPVLTATAFYFQRPVSPVLISIAGAWAKPGAQGKGVAIPTTCPDNSSPANPVLLYIHLGLGCLSGRSRAPHVRWGRGKGMPICIVAASAHFTASLHRFLLLKFFTRGNLQVLCIRSAHLIESQWGKGCADVTVLPAGYKGIDFPGPHAHVLSQPDLLQKHQGELKS